MQERPEGIEVRWRTPCTGEKSVRVARVINCTGPASNYAKVDLPLVVQMRRSGWLTPDALNLGLETDTEGRLIDADGETSPDLYAVGSLRRPSWWESIATPEIREQAAAIAEIIGPDGRDKPWI